MLIAGWICTWIEKDRNCIIDLLSFCDPKFSYSNEPEPFTTKNVHLHDYYSIDVNQVVNKNVDNLDYILETIEPKFRNVVIVDCLSSLVLYTGLVKTLRFIEKLSMRVPQLVCIYRRDFIQNKIPAIDTLGTTYVKLDRLAGISPLNNIIYSAMLVHRKMGGSVICQTEVINQDSTTFHINAERIVTLNDRKLEQTNANQLVKIESSFRMEMNAQEMRQRDMTPLPYVLNAATNTSKIHYEPDAVDDIDEDDPDDDLCF